MHLHAFVDGSFINSLAGWGVVIGYSRGTPILALGGCIPKCPEYSMRNILGEVESAKKALEIGIMVGANHLTIYHDYLGLSNWVNGTWKTKNPYTKAYAEAFRSKPETLSVDFCKVAAHSGDTLNDMADDIAKQATFNGDIAIILDKTAVKQLSLESSYIHNILLQALTPPGNGKAKGR